MNSIDTNRTEIDPITAKLFIDGSDVGILIDISSGTITGPRNNQIYESTIDLLCEKLNLTRIKPESKLGPYKKVKRDDPLIDSNCVICLDKFKENGFKRDLKCGHIFHKKCIDKWLKNHSGNCPICRKNVY